MKSPLYVSLPENAVTYSKNFFYFTKFLKFINQFHLCVGEERFLQNTYSDHVY